MPIKNAVNLFDNCLGLNDGVDSTSAQVNTQTGASELVACSGITLAETGKIKGADNFVLESTVLAANIVSISAKTLCLVQAGTKLYLYSNGVFTVVTYLGSEMVVVGTVPVIHTELDIRFVSNGVVYKIVNGSSVATLVTVGAWPGPQVSVEWARMPVFTGGFTLNGILYIWNGDFLQYSPPWTYDCWNLGDDFIPVLDTVVEATGIPGCICIIGLRYVTLLVGSGPSDFVFKQYPITGYAKTLVAGYSNRVGEVIMFTAADGIYAVTSDGQLQNLTAGRFDKTLAGTYVGASLSHHKYTAVCSTGANSIEYHFETKAVVRGAYTGVSGVANKLGTVLYAVGKSVYHSTQQTSVSCSITFPLTDFQSPKRKRVRALYITGVVKGALTVTLYAADGKSKSEVVTLDGFVNNYRITGFGGVVHNLLGIKLELAGTFLYLDSIRAVVYEVQ